MFLILIVYFCFYDFYCNIKCNVGSHIKNTTILLKLTYHYFILSVYLVQRPDDN